MSQERVHWMDLLRGTAVFLIIVWHATLLPAITGGSMPIAAEAINNALSPYRVPLLLVMSGMLLERSLRKGFRRYVAGKLRNILWPLIVWLIVFLVVSGQGPDFYDPWFWSRDLYLWYLVVILLAYAVGVSCLWVPPWVTLCALLIMNEWFISTNSYRRVVWYICFFLIGAILVRWVEKLQGLTWRWAAIGALVALAWGVYVAVVYRYAPTSEPVFLLMSMPGVLVALWVAPRISRTKWVKKIEFIGVNSIVAYVVHFPAQFLVQRVLDAVGISFAWVTFPALLAVGLGAAWWVAKARKYCNFLFAFPGSATRR